MEKFDVIVVGAGSGLTIVDGAASHGLKVALIEKGPMGGTCLNRGCIPSKMLIHSADIAETINNSEKFGIKSKGFTVNFKKMVSRVSRIVDADAREIEEGIKEDKNIALFKGDGKFIGKRKMKVGSSIIGAEKVFIMAGTRPLVPPIEGLKDVKFLTSKEALRLKKLPKSLTIIGGGYIAAELAHFFGSLGTKINILQRGPLLVNREDQEVAETFTTIFRKKYNVLLGYDAQKVQHRSGKYIVTASHGKLKKTLRSDELLLAVGRVPNSDILDVTKGGMKVNERGYIETNDFLETTARHTWAGGDIAGKYFFKHSANVDSQYMFQNAFNQARKMKADYTAMPHAVFSSPQIAGVGATQQELKRGTYAVGKYPYMNTGMGAALQDTTGFVKFLVDRKSRKILGCHIIGPQASTLLHEVLIAMKSGSSSLSDITRVIHIHPALSEVVQRAARSVKF